MRAKPPAGTPIDWSHPLAPRSKTGIFLPFNGGGNLPVDLVQNAQFSPYQNNSLHGTAYYDPCGPAQLANPQSMRFLNATYSSIYQSPGSLNGDVTLACIFKQYSSQGDGPRLINTGDNCGVALEPGHGGNTIFNVLYGSVEHISIPIIYSLGHWYFFGISTRQSGLYFDCFVFDYDICQSFITTISTGAHPSPTNGQFLVGGDEGDYAHCSDSSMYWALIDYAYWSPKDMAQLAADPWCFLRHEHRNNFYGISSQPESTAAFISTDTSTQGNWIGKYGSQGYYKSIGATPNEPEISLPGYVNEINVTGTLYSWLGSTTDVRALQDATGGNRTPSCWYSFTNFTFSINVNDNAVHQLAIYSLDWDYNNARSESYTITDTNSGATLASTTVSAFSGGLWDIIEFSGDITITVTAITGNAVTSGLFFDPIPTYSVFDFGGGVLEGGKISNYAF